MFELDGTFEYFERLGETDDLSFVHPAEYLALQRIAGQICKGTSAMFKPEYNELLAAVRARLANGFDGVVPGLSTRGEA